MLYTFAMMAVVLTAAASPMPEPASQTDVVVREPAVTTAPREQRIHEMVHARIIDLSRCSIVGRQCDVLNNFFSLVDGRLSLLQRVSDEAWIPDYSGRLGAAYTVRTRALTGDRIRVYERIASRDGRTTASVTTTVALHQMTATLVLFGKRRLLVTIAFDAPVPPLGNVPDSKPSPAGRDEASP